jgi:hypothetical protein
MIAIDGPAPKAKMNQQRIRRMGNDSSPLDYFDPVMISPGTKFMDSLEAYITKVWIAGLKDIVDGAVNIVYSGHREIGEGEHKIFHYMSSVSTETRTRALKVSTIGNRTPVYVILGNDGDLAVIPIVRPQKVIFMRSNFQESKDGATLDVLEAAIRSVVKTYASGNINPVTSEIERSFGKVFERSFQYMRVDKLAEQIGEKFLKPFSTIDFVPIVTMCGNDFIPPIPDMDAISVNAPAIYTDEQIEEVYLESHNAAARKIKTSKLVSNSKARAQFKPETFWKEFHKVESTWTNKSGTVFVNTAVGLYNQKLNQEEIYPLQEDTLLKSQRRILYTRKTKADPFKVFKEDTGTLITALNVYRDLSSRISMGGRTNIKTFLLEYRFQINYFSLYRLFKELYYASQDLMKSHAAHYNFMLDKGLPPSCIIEKSIGQTELTKYKSDPTIVPAAFLRLHRANSAGIYDSRYADSNLPKQSIDEMCRMWLEGLQWTLKYYSEGLHAVNSQWFYPFRQAPCLFDLINYLDKFITVSVHKFPWIYIPRAQSKTRVTSYVVTGTYIIQDVLNNYSAFTTYGRGSISVFAGPKGYLARWELSTGDTKTIDLDQLLLTTIDEAPLYKRSEIPESVKIIVIVENPKGTIVDIPIEHTFTEKDSIMYAIDNHRIPYSSHTIMLFSIMPVRALRLIFSHELVEAVISQLTDCFPDRLEIEEENQLYGGTNIIGYPSPTRVKDIIDALPVQFSNEIARMNIRKDKVYLVRNPEAGKGHMEKIYMTNYRTMYDYPNLDIHRIQKGATLVGGLGNEMGGIYPEYKQFMDHKHPPSEKKSDNDLQSRIKMFPITKMYGDNYLTENEKNVLKIIKSKVNSFPNPIADVPWTYDNIPSDLPYNHRPYTPPNVYQAINPQRGQLMQSIRFLSSYVIRNKQVSDDGNNRVTILCIGEDMEHVAILATIFHFFDFHVWSLYALRLSEKSKSLKNLQIRVKTEFTHAYGIQYRSKKTIILFNYRTEPQENTSIEREKMYKNLKMEKNLITIINPLTAMRKINLFAAAIYTGSNDIVCNQGTIWLPIYHGYQSNTMNLLWVPENSEPLEKTNKIIKTIFSGSYSKIDPSTTTIDVPTVRIFQRESYQNTLHYYNAVLRPYMKIENFFQIPELEVTGFTSTLDQSYEIFCWSIYHIMLMSLTVEQRSNIGLPMVIRNNEYRFRVVENMTETNKFFGQSLYFERVPANKYYGIYRNSDSVSPDHYSRGTLSTSLIDDKKINQCHTPSSNS